MNATIKNAAFNKLDISKLLGYAGASSTQAPRILEMSTVQFTTVGSITSGDSFFRQGTFSSLSMTALKVQNASTPRTDNYIRLQSGGVVDIDMGVVVRHANDLDTDLPTPAPTGPDQAESDPQLATNLEQAADISRQLGLGNGAVWGMESIAKDLAVFGLDFTAFSQDPDALERTIRDKSLELIAKLDETRNTDVNYDANRRIISGASARLMNGIRNGGGQVARATSSIQSSWNINSVVQGLANAGSANTVTVDGKRIDAGFIIGVGNVIVDPLVLDLAGDGIDLKGADEGVHFDMDGTGEKSKMGFIRGDDALLFIDTYGDGIVHDGRQLFGNQDGHANGFEMLRSFDENGDGVIDENDAIWDQLRVWVEKTEDGVCEEGETMSLREAGITSINVGYKDVREDDGKGNLIGQVGQFTRDDGSTGLAADAWFQKEG